MLCDLPSPLPEASDLHRRRRAAARQVAAGPSHGKSRVVQPGLFQVRPNVFGRGVRRVESVPQILHSAPCDCHHLHASASYRLERKRSTTTLRQERVYEEVLSYHIHNPTNLPHGLSRIESKQQASAKS